MINLVYNEVSTEHIEKMNIKPCPAIVDIAGKLM